jgi:hypothetical protein
MKPEEEERESIQMKPALPSSPDGKRFASNAMSQKLSSTKGAGKALPDGIGAEMSRKIGSDFSGVRVHTDAQAVQMNREVGAQAFTYGSDIYFDTGKYDPGSSKGKHLLAHELTHVVQQTGGLQTDLIQRDLRRDYSGQWGTAQTQLNAMYGGIGGVIDRQKGAVTDFLRYAKISDQSSIGEQVLINGINILLGAVIPGIGGVIKTAVKSMVQSRLKGTVESIVDSMVDAGKGAAQGAVKSAWRETAGAGTPIVKFAETQRRALETIAQIQIASMNKEFARLLTTEGENDEWEAGDALYKSFQQSLDCAYNEQFNKMTDIWFTMQTGFIGGGARPGVLRITLKRRYPDRGSFLIDDANLLGSGSVQEIRARLARRKLKDITIPKFIQMNGKMGMGIQDCNWSIRVSGAEPSPKYPTISAKRTNLESLMAGSQRLMGYGGHKFWGWPWLAAHHLGISDLEDDDYRNTAANRSAGAREIWDAVKNMSPGSIDASNW